MLADGDDLVRRLGAFYTADEIRLWLSAIHPMLDGRRAIDLVDEGRTDEVLAVIEGLQTGAYT